MKNAVFRTSHGFAKPRHLHAIKSKLNIPKKNLICQQPVQSLRFQSKPGRLYIGRRNASDFADRRVMRGLVSNFLHYAVSGSQS
jgi:hypothetical protein